MSITFEEFQKIEMLDLKKHIQLVDSYISSGLDIDDITIRYAVDQERVLIVLHGYGFSAGPAYGDDSDTKKKYKGIAFPYVEAYITAYYPGLITGIRMDNTNSQTFDKHMAIEDFLDENFPDWRSSLSQQKSSLFGISTDELKGAAYYDTFGKIGDKRKDKLKQKEGFFKQLRKIIEK
jgi:hypothetical protein